MAWQQIGSEQTDIQKTGIPAQVAVDHLALSTASPVCAADSSVEACRIPPPSAAPLQRLNIVNRRLVLITIRYPKLFSSAQKDLFRQKFRFNTCKLRQSDVDCFIHIRFTSHYLLIRHRLQPRESNICLGICMNHI
jgi:hypothetical protein